MRLLSYDSAGNLRISRDLSDDEVEPYAILSHTWLKDEDEVKYSEVESPLSQTKPGFKKIDFCGKQAQQDKWQHFWVDTSCIDKTNLVELSKAITSMYRWYEQAQICYVYLADVSSLSRERKRTPDPSWESSFRQSRWFRRGWTLQELLAPRNLVFYSKEWHRLGTKEELKDLISNITGIPTAALEGRPLSQFAIIERMRWTHGRQTKVKEDQAYCLFGIFGVFLPLIYGEGDYAFRRLQKELDTQSGGEVTRKTHDYSFQNPVGLCLGQAPTIERKYFIGRDDELDQMDKMLLFDDANCGQRRLVLGGMGGVGKTQLALAYAQRHVQQYDSVFWLNAISEATVVASFHSIARRIFSPEAYEAIDPQHLPNYVHSWLSHSRNTCWLLIFDNYDDPQMYDIRSSYPDAAQGTIVITTRRPDLVAGEQVPVKPLVNPEEGLQILQTRSGRDDTGSDTSACHLVERLAGLPLALATAGTFLRKSTWSFQQYLDAYEARWNVTTRRPLILTEYQDRTLYTTWQLSYDRLQKEDADAAKFLKLFAYFDHQAIWYSLLRAGSSNELPDWLLHIVNDPNEFESAMQILVDYCFLETQAMTQTYSMHTCVHDWIVAGLNQPLEPWSYWYAFSCVVGSIDSENWDTLGHVRYAGLAPHAIRLLDVKLDTIEYELSEDNLQQAEDIAAFLTAQIQLTAAEKMYRRTLAGYEKALGPDHTSTLTTVHNLGLLYRDQGKLAEAEQMYNRALAGYEKALGPDHKSTLAAVNNLGSLYWAQGKLAEVEQMYDRALTGKEKALGPDHTSTLDTVHNLGFLYWDQGKLAEAEQMYNRALAGYEKALGPDHKSTLGTVNSLGVLYWAQGMLAEAEQMYNRALAGYEKVLGPDHTSTLDTVNNLGNLYRDQGKLAEAEQVYNRALTGKEKALGPDHTLTLDTVNNLGSLYWAQGKLPKAEQMYNRALTGKEKALGPDHKSTLDTVNNLGILYWDQGKLAEAEQMYDRALTGKEKALGPDHKSTLAAVHNLGSLYSEQGKLAEAEQMYDRALTGKEKALGPDHTSTLDTVHNLGLLYRDQGKLAEAEGMYDRALTGCEKALGKDHTSTLATVHDLGLLYSEQGKLAEAEAMYDRAMAGYQEVLNDDHPEKLEQTLDYANLFVSQLELEKARQMYQQTIDICAKSLPDTKSRSQSVANTYTKALSKMVGILRSTSTNPRPYLRSLIEYLRQEDRVTVMMIQYLAKALLHLRDDENVQLALFLCGTDSIGPWLDLGGMRCDACCHRLNTDTGMSVCRQCVDTNFCDACLSTIQNRTLSVLKCQHNQFYNFGETIQRARQSSKLQTPTAMDTWLDKLGRQYAAALGC